MVKKIKTVEYLGENYDDVSDYCNFHQEPIFFTKDEKIDLVAMSIKSYEKLSGCCDLHILLDEGCLRDGE